IPTFRINSTTGTPTSACFSTPTICSTPNRFFFISKISLQILPKTNTPSGSEIPGPITHSFAPCDRSHEQRVQQAAAQTGLGTEENVLFFKRFSFSSQLLLPWRFVKCLHSRSENRVNRILYHARPSQ